jgi:thymidylate synthase
MLGVPYNIASMSILLKIMSKVSNMLPGVATWIGGDTHLYVNHLPAVDEQLARETKELPTMEIKKEINTLEDILALKFEDFELKGYDPHPKLTNPTDLFTGIKKLPKQ